MSNTNEISNNNNAAKKAGFFSIGLVRGLIGLLIGLAAGALLVTVIRAFMGLDAWDWGPSARAFGFSEPAWVTGALLGGIGFLLGVGVLNDWLKWMAGIETPEQPQDAFPSGWARYLSVSYDHKAIGLQYGFTALVMFATAGLFALIFRTELATPALDMVSYDWYNSIMSLHGIIMIFSILLGVAAMSNYLVPLMIGANDMAFPRLNALAFWLNVPAGVLLLSSLLLGGFDTGWTGYPPLSTRAPLGMQMFFLGVYLFGLSSILGSLNIIVTTLRMRAKGMSLFRMPIFVWTSLATSVISLTATQLIALSFQMVIFERLFGMGFFNPDLGGDPILFQHLFWFRPNPIPAPVLVLLPPRRLCLCSDRLGCDQ